MVGWMTLDDWNGIQPVKSSATYPQRFSSGTNRGGRPRGVGSSLKLGGSNWGGVWERVPSHHGRGVWEWAVPSPREKFWIVTRNGVLWCILMHYFRASMLEVASWNPRGPLGILTKYREHCYSATKVGGAVADSAAPVPTDALARRKMVCRFTK